MCLQIDLQSQPELTCQVSFVMLNREDEESAVQNCAVEMRRCEVAQQLNNRRRTFSGMRKRSSTQTVSFSAEERRTPLSFVWPT